MNSAHAHRWLELKEIERSAAEERRQLEDQMRKELRIADDEEGTVKHVVDNYTVKATCRVNRKINPETFLMLADRDGISINDFTKWKCELIMSAWRKQPPEVVKALMPAITSEPGRATFSIEFNDG
jgi:hypothetical protein